MPAPYSNHSSVGAHLCVRPSCFKETKVDKITGSPNPFSRLQRFTNSAPLGILNPAEQARHQAAPRNRKRKSYLQLEPVFSSTKIRPRCTFRDSEPPRAPEDIVNQTYTARVSHADAPRGGAHHRKRFIKQTKSTAYAMLLSVWCTFRDSNPGPTD